MDEKKEFAQKLKSVMVLRGVSASKLAQISGVGKATLSRYIQGQVFPKSKKIYALSQALHISPTWLWGISTDDSPFKKDNKEKLSSQICETIKYMNEDKLKKILIFIETFIQEEKK